MGLLAVLTGLLVTAEDLERPVRAVEPKSLAKMPEAAARPVDFVRDIRPILQRSCYRCHGPEKQKSGLRLDARAGVAHGRRGFLRAEHHRG